MSQSALYTLVISTCPDAETAKKIAKVLVESRCAACVNILGGIRSVYQWKGQVEIDDEHLLIIKTRIEEYHTVERSIVEHHPYEVPEVVRVPIEEGLSGYLRWIDECVEVNR